MLSEKNYHELLPFRDGSICLGKDLNERVQYLIDEKLIVPNSFINEYLESSDEWVIGIPKDWQISSNGIDALEEFERYVREKCAKEKKDKEDAENQRTANRFDMLTFGAVSAIIGSFIGGLIVYYWPTIASLFTKLVQ